MSQLLQVEEIRSSWLPFYQSAYLPLPDFANCYSTTCVHVPVSPRSPPAAIDAATAAAVGSATAASTTSATAMRPQLLIATSSQLFALQCSNEKRERMSDKLHLPSALQSPSVADGTCDATAAATATTAPSTSAVEPVTTATAPSSSPADAADAAPTSSASASLPRSYDSRCTDAPSRLLPLLPAALPPPSFAAATVEIIAVTSFDVECESSDETDGRHASLSSLTRASASAHQSKPLIAIAFGVIAPRATTASAAAASAANAAVAAGDATPSNSETQQERRTEHTVPNRFFLNIYGANSCIGGSLEQVLQDVQCIALPFIPAVLKMCPQLRPTVATATHVVVAAAAMPDILLAGSDRTVHLYRCSTVAAATAVSTLKYHELTGDGHPLPSLQLMPSAAISLAYAVVDPLVQSDGAADGTGGGSDSSGRRMLIAVGCQDGMLRLVSFIDRSSFPLRLSSEPTRSAEEADGLWQMGAATGTTATAAASTASTAANILSRDIFFSGPLCDVSFFNEGCATADANGSADNSKLSALEKHAKEHVARAAFAHASQEEEEDDWSEISYSSSSDDDDVDTREPMVQQAATIAKAPAAHVQRLHLLLCNASGEAVVLSNLDCRTLEYSTTHQFNCSGCLSSSSAVSSHSRFLPSYCALSPSPLSSHYRMPDPATDAVLCATAADINLDGRFEILVGTYSSLLLIFQQDFADDEGAENTDATTAYVSRFASITPRGFKLAAMKQFSHPIYSIQCVDLHSQGICDIVLTTQWSVTVLSWSPESALHVFASKLALLEDIERLEEAVRRKQAEAAQAITGAEARLSAPNVQADRK